MFVIMSGRSRSGKDTFAIFLAEELFKQTGRVYVLMAYAHELKRRVQKDFGLSYDQLWGDKKEGEDQRYPKGDKFWTAREILQQYGEFFRSINFDFWVGKLFSIIDEKEYTNVIVTDGRYPNEVDPILERDGYHIRINRVVENKIHGKNHSSETSLDVPYKVDFTVSNNGTFEDLKKLASDIVNGILQLEKFRN